MMQDKVSSAAVRSKNVDRLVLATNYQDACVMQYCSLRYSGGTLLDTSF